MSKKFEDILSTIDDEVLNEGSKKAIVEAFEHAVNERVDTRVKLEVEEAAQQLDESHADKLQTLLEAIDEDHTNKLKKVLGKVDADYAEKLEQVIEKYESMVKDEAIEFRDELTTEMSNYMDMYLKTMLPEEQIQEAVENTQAKKIVDAVKELVSIDEDYISDTIRGALEDGKGKIDSLSEELSEAVRTNILINQDLKKTKTSLMLEQKTAEFDQNKKRYVMRVLSEKSPDEVEENFDYVVEMFERDESEETKVLTESAAKVVKSKVVDTPEAEKEETPIIESAPVPQEEAVVTGYLDMLKEQDG
jgi:hypothetical protein